jgi:hypothetical protein
MPSGHADRIDHFGAQLFGQLWKLLALQAAQGVRIGDRIEQRRFRTHRAACPEQVCPIVWTYGDPESGKAKGLKSMCGDRAQASQPCGVSNPIVTCHPKQPARLRERPFP